ncbi:MAG: hypothetical protein HPY61_03705 [Methanotrichaceae archaeon]|nr:hypothetical protein [Methanotrichaceae archaeon]
MSKKDDKTLAECNPTCKDMLVSIFMVLIGFLIAYVFASSLSDINGYIEDHNFYFDRIELLIIVLFMVIFYTIPKILFSVFNYIFPHWRYNSRLVFYLIGTLSICLILAFIWYNFSSVASLRGAEAEALRWTVLIWLASLLLLNILLGTDLFQIIIGKIVTKIKNFFRSFSNSSGELQ